MSDLANMVIATIELKWSPPIDWLDRVPGLRPDLGGYCYRIRYECGRMRIFGTCRTLEEACAKTRALHVARKAGFTHYRMANDQTVEVL